MVYFEKAAITALKHHFPDVIVKACWYHFRKDIFNKDNRLKKYCLGLKNEQYKIESMYL